MRTIESGEMIYSKFHQGWIKVVRRDNNENWWYMDSEGKVSKACIPLQVYEAREQILAKGGE